MTSSYVSLMDEQSADESDSPQTKRGSAMGRKGGRLGGGSDSWGVVMSDETCGRM